MRARRLPSTNTLDVHKKLKANPPLESIKIYVIWMAAFCTVTKKLSLFSSYLLITPFLPPPPLLHDIDTPTTISTTCTVSSCVCACVHLFWFLYWFVCGPPTPRKITEIHGNTKNIEKQCFFDFMHTKSKNI